MHIQHEALLDEPNIKHGFFTRNGGTSNEPYNSLNCGYGSDDAREQVSQNRAQVAHVMGVEPSHLITAYQIHSPDVVVADKPFSTYDLPKADAIVTQTPGLAIAVLTADCGPLLFADPKAGIIAAAHAGWRGALNGIIENTIAAMRELGAQNSNITAILGPTISGSNYEVDQAFMDRFIEHNEEYKAFFEPGSRQGHVQFDLPAFILARLQKSAIKAAINLNRCTYGQEDQFFSYRRATHRNEPDYGRQISTIALR